MAPYGPPVTNPADPQQNKDAVDNIYKGMSTKPTYITLVGAPHVVAMIVLDVPPLGPAAFSDEDGAEPAVGAPEEWTLASDLPYASDSPYSTTIASFMNPTRQVGRIPGMAGSTDVQLLLNALAAAASTLALPKKTYQDSNYALQAQASGSQSTMMLTGVLGEAVTVLTSPESTATGLSGKAFTYFNLHGGQGKPAWHGEALRAGQPPSRSKKTVAVESATLTGIKPGSIVVALVC
jgi:hypothetical protein